MPNDAFDDALQHISEAEEFTVAIIKDFFCSDLLENHAFPCVTDFFFEEEENNFSNSSYKKMNLRESETTI